MAGKLEPVIGEGVEDALAGVSIDRDALLVATAMAEARGAFGELKCAEVVPAATTAIQLLAARQAAGQAVPELPRAWAYVLTCADLAGDVDRAMLAASRLRAVGGAAAVDPALLAKYPSVDVVSGTDLVELDVTSEVPGAALWVDFQPAGKTPAHLVLPAGEHVIAAAAGTRRGLVSGPAVPAQKALTIPMPDQAGPWSGLATRIAGWHGAMPSPAELAWVLGQVHARVALIRHGDTVEAWGQAGRAEAPHRLGGDDGSRPLAEADKLVALVVDRVEGWNDHAPDPDRPLLVETPQERARRTDHAEEPAKWWVYAALAGAIAAGAIVIYAHESASDTQHVELHYP